MAWAYRNMIVADAVVETCRSLAMLLAGEGQKLWTTPLSTDGKEPTTHWISTGLIEDKFAELLPLSSWKLEEDVWTETVISAGQPELLANLSIEAGFTTTKEQIEFIFSKCSVTEEEPTVAISRMKLQSISTENLL